MSSSIPEITTHPSFRSLSNDFFKPYPPYVLVNSESDAAAVLKAGCESGYLVVLDASAPSGTKSLSTNNTQEYKERVGIVAYTLPTDKSNESKENVPNEALSALASQLLNLLATGGTMIGFGDSQKSDAWKQACEDWAQREKVRDTEGKEQDGVVVEWSVKEAREDGWVPWSVVKKAPEWAFC
ncbi:hypothetical protein BDV93DRAFT_526669 [Ceratobasidium sp. AG-I]|nr:hypothetical protein BDV93DRAFT_526669 [Ceratobasidium sp. AG-I]